MDIDIHPPPLNIVLYCLIRTTLTMPILSAATAGQKVLFFSPILTTRRSRPEDISPQSIINGADVRIVLITDGNKDHNKAIRYSDFRTATGILGVPDTNLVFLNFPDNGLSSENRTTLQTILRFQIENYHPDIVIYPHPLDYNPDHSAIGWVMCSILTDEPASTARYEYLVHYAWKFPQRLYLLPPNRLFKTDKEWLTIPLSQPVEDLKQKAMLTYRSQFHSLELNGLLHSSVRKNELLSIP
jgi:N-acetylglucosamine malate deacetylase 1